MLFDTAFLIHASGQRGRKQQAAAEHFLQSHLDTPLYASRVSWSEFAEGCASPHELHAALHRFAIVEIDETVAWIASRVARELKPAGMHIGDYDVWIAATALAYDLPLVSRNTKHFARITSLQIAAY